MGGKSLPSIMFLASLIFISIASADEFSDDTWTDEDFYTSFHLAWERFDLPSSVTMERAGEFVHQQNTLFHEVEVLDFNGDGYSDLLYGRHDQGSCMMIAYYDSVADLWHTTDVYTAPYNYRLKSMDTGDFDLDGLPDPVGFFRKSFGTFIMWFDYRDGYFYSMNVGELGCPLSYCLCAVDVDSDGDDDIISSYNNTEALALWRNNHSVGCFQKLFMAPAGLPMEIVSIESGDLDGDGDMDLVICGVDPDGVFVMENVSSDGLEWTVEKVSSGYHEFDSSVICDIDGDGDLDIAASGDRLVCLENRGGMEWEERILSIDPAGFVAVGDLDSDDELDLVTLPHSLDSHPSPAQIWFDTGGWEYENQYFASVKETSECLAVADFENTGTDRVCIDSVLYSEQPLLADSGYLTSRWHYSTNPPDVVWGNIFWQVYQPPGSSVYFRIRTWDYGSPSSWSQPIVESGDSLLQYIEDPLDSRIQYRAVLSRGAGQEQIELQWVAITYQPLGIEGSGEITEMELAVLQNPSSATTVLRAAVTESGIYHLRVYDIRGSLLISLEEDLQEGFHDIALSGLGSGRYFAVMQWNDRTASADFLVLH